MRYRTRTFKDAERCPFLKQNIMKTETKQVHKCDFCNKKLFVKGAMQRHEDNCTNNPKNWAACHECTFCKLVQKPILQNGIYADRWVDSNSYYCSNENIKKEMHPHKAVRKGLIKSIQKRLRIQF